jgi:hypothetical protein
LTIYLIILLPLSLKKIDFQTKNLSLNSRPSSSIRLIYFIGVSSGQGTHLGQQGMIGTFASCSPGHAEQEKLFGCLSPCLFVRQACPPGRGNPCQPKRAKSDLLPGQGWRAHSCAHMGSLRHRQTGLCAAKLETLPPDQKSAATKSDFATTESPCAAAELASTSPNRSLLPPICSLN